MWTTLHCPLCFPFVVWCKEQKAFVVEDVLFYNFRRCTAIMLIALGSGRFFCCGTQVSQSGYVSWQHFYSREVKGETYKNKIRQIWILILSNVANLNWLWKLSNNRSGCEKLQRMWNSKWFMWTINVCLERRGNFAPIPSFTQTPITHICVKC